MPTIIELAKHAGVSKTTISRYLNGEAKGHISPETQKRIKQAIEELNYRPNDLARGLKKKQTNVIGVITNDLTNVFFLQMIKGIEAELYRADYNMMVCNSAMSIDREIELLKMLDQKRMDGIIVIGLNMPAEHVTKLGIHAPIVLFERDAGKTGYDSIKIDNKTGVEMVMKHLIQKGYKRIAHIEGARESVVSKERKELFYKTMQEAGRTVRPEYVVAGNYSMDQAYEAMKQLCGLKVPPDAVFCSNDLMAFGAVRYLMEHNYRIPDDMAVAGYDDIDMAAMLRPELTTVHQPVLELARKGTRMLLNRIRQSKEIPEEPQLIVLTPSLVIRKTS